MIITHGNTDLLKGKDWYMVELFEGHAKSTYKRLVDSFIVLCIGR